CLPDAVPEMKAFEAAVVIAAGMDEDNRFELFRLAPERPELRIAKFHGPSGSRDRDPLESQFADAALEPAHCERRYVQRQRAEPDQPAPVQGHGPWAPIRRQAGKP